MTDGIDIGQLRDVVVRPTLKLLGLWSPAAEELVIGTILQESGGGHWLHQLGSGPAVGICQMEPTTHDDLWNNFLRFRPELAAKVKSLMIGAVADVDEMAGNLYYAVAMCRVHYLRVKDPLPPVGDVTAQAAYYKAHYNTGLGAATTAQYIANWYRAFA